MMIKENWNKIVYVILALLIISMGLAILPELSIIESLRIVFGSVYVLFLPGFIITFIFFKEKQIEVIERIALSFALSIAIVPLLIFYLNLIGMKINLLNSTLTILGIITVSILTIYFKIKHKK